MTSRVGAALDATPQQPIDVATAMLGATVATPKFLALFGVVWCYLDIKIFAKHVEAAEEPVASASDSSQNR
jgi:hypothetical protein